MKSFYLTGPLIIVCLILFFVSQVEIAACVTIVTAILEYYMYRCRTYAEVLSQYNQRLSTEKCYKVAVKILNNFFDENGSLKNKSNYDINTSLFEKELFLKLFEDIEVSIEHGRLKEKYAYQCLSYYAIIASKCGDNFVPDYNEKCWEKFHEFVKRMDKIKNGL